MERRMLRHKSYIQAARYAFGLSGIYDEDEGRDIIRNQTQVKALIEMPEAIEGNVPPVIPDEASLPEKEGTWVCGGCGVENTEPAEKRDPEYCFGCGLFRGEDPEAGHYIQPSNGELEL
jgi:hypothetical protein